MIKQRPVADIIRDFADLLDSERSREALSKADPLRVKLADMLDAVGRYAERIGADLRAPALEQLTEMKHGKGLLPSRRLTGELRRFADALQSREDAVRRADPRFEKLAMLVRAMGVYASWLGVDLGVAGGVIVKDKIREGTL